jgi:hypothetical protein
MDEIIKNCVHGGFLRQGRHKKKTNDWGFCIVTIFYNFQLLIVLCKFFPHFEWNPILAIKILLLFKFIFEKTLQNAIGKFKNSR